VSDQPPTDATNSNAATPEEATSSVHHAPRRDLADVNAATVVLERSGAETVTADTLRMDRSGARSIDARTVEMDRSGTVALGSDQAVLRDSSAVQVVGEHVELVDSRAVFVSAGEATIERSRIVVFAGHATGDVQTLFTTKSAAMLGGAFALVLALLSVVFRARGRREATGNRQ
jgi:hypothetical protein